MIRLEQISKARNQLLQQVTNYFSEQSEVVGILLAGSLPSGTSDPYSDIDLRVIATPQYHAHLVANRLSIPKQWGDWLFNEWLEGTEHCVSHFRPFFKVDVFYWNQDCLRPSPWYSLPTEVLLDRNDVVRAFLAESAQLKFQTVNSHEASRVLSKALACAHEVVRRARRGELFYAHTLLEGLRSYLVQIEDWLAAFTPSVAGDLKLHNRISVRLDAALKGSYVGLNSSELEAAVGQLCGVLTQQISELHGTFNLDRSMGNDMDAVRLITEKQIGS